MMCRGVLCVNTLCGYIWVRINVSESGILNDLESEATEVMTKILHLNIKFMGRRNNVRGLKD